MNMGFLDTTDTSATQPLQLRLWEHLVKGGKNIVRAWDQGNMLWQGSWAQEHSKKRVPKQYLQNDINWLLIVNGWNLICPYCLKCLKKSSDAKD